LDQRPDIRSSGEHALVYSARKRRVFQPKAPEAAFRVGAFGDLRTEADEPVIRRYFGREV